MSGLTHFDEKGKPRMVDVGAKPETERRALAGCRVYMRPETFQLIQDKKRLQKAMCSLLRRLPA